MHSHQASYPLVYLPSKYAAKLVPMTYDQRYINGTTILSADRQVCISSVGLSVVPQVGDIVTAGGVDYHVIGRIAP